MMRIMAALPAELAGSRVSRLLPALGLLLFGLVLLYGVGFSAIPAAHEAAHDTRHAIAFPCH